MTSLTSGRPALAERFAPTRRNAPQAGPLNRRGVPLATRQSPGIKLLGLTFVALFWNGIVSVFLFHVVKSWASGRVEVCMTIFLVPFVVIGVGMIFAALHALLALFNPRCALTLDKSEPALGDTADVRWTFTGRYDRIHRLVIRVEAREEATYRQGTSTHTDKNVFLTLDVVDTTRAVDIRTGKARFTIPQGTMHSFTAPNNKIVWSVPVHGHIAGWPDVKDEYPLTVHPLPPGRTQLAEHPEEPDHEASDAEDGEGDGSAAPEETP